MIGAAIIVGCLCGILGYLIGKEKYRPMEGAALGFFLGPLGVLIAFCMKDLAERTIGYQPQQSECSGCGGTFDTVSMYDCGDEWFCHGCHQDVVLRKRKR